MISANTPSAYSTVILVDNSSIDNFVNTRIITRYHFANEVIEFTKPRKALKYLLDLNSADETEIPSVLFLDLDMPEINGLEFLDAFSFLPDKIKKNVKIVILTSSIDPADELACSKSESVVAFFQKPLIKDNLDRLNLLLNSSLVLTKQG